jgi:hypothetical protein
VEERSGFLMTYDDFAAMRQEGDPRRVYGAGETPLDLAARIDVALEQIIAEGTEPNG